MSCSLFVDVCGSSQAGKNCNLSCSMFVDVSGSSQAGKSCNVSWCCRSSSYHGPGPRRLKAALPDVLTMLHDMAVDPTSDVWSSTTAEAAAWLSFRELVSLLPPPPFVKIVTLSLTQNVFDYIFIYSDKMQGRKDENEIPPPSTPV